VVGMTTGDGHLQIGELARAAGLTVRTLHHYDEIGLLVPDERSYSGRRLYSRSDAQRLYRIVALRRVGLSLDEIGAVLDEGRGLQEAVERHLERVEHKLELATRLQGLLHRMLALLRSGEQPALEQFTQAIEVMTMTDRYYTPEQHRRLEDRRRELGEEGMARAQQEWAQLIEEARAQRALGTDPADPRMAALARHWRALVEQFTGGDDATRRSLQTMYRTEGPSAASQGMVDPELMEYVGAAMRALPDAD
jgi:MerR family transcriptional regulator, thiopeptide resistance regulator